VFNEDETEEVLSIMDTRAFDVLMREIGYLVQHKEQKLLKSNCSDISQGELLILKASTEGAQRLLVDFNVLLNNLKLKGGR